MKSLDIKRLRYNGTEKYYENKTFIIPILYEKVLLKEEGDYIEDEFGNYRYGNIRLTIEVDNADYMIVNDNDLMLSRDISIYEYLYEINYSFRHMDEDIGVKIENPHITLSRHENDLIYIIENKGLPLNYESEDRGKLILCFSINKSKKLSKDKIMAIY